MSPESLTDAPRDTTLMFGGIRMQKTLLLCLVLFTGLSGLFGQNMYEAQTELYRVLSSVSPEHARETAAAADALARLYNEYFRFDLDTLPSRMNVRIFADRADFDRHLNRIIGETRNEPVYLHFTDHARSELVGFVMDDFEQFRASLTHQSVIQFMRAFVQNPPLWLREGFAVYFEDSYYDPDRGEAVFRANTSWLETLQSLITGSGPVMPLAEVLSADVSSARAQLDTFYPQTWGMITFLTGSEDRQHNRMLWDAIAALEPQASLQENINLIHRRVLRWVDTDELITDFSEFVIGMRSFRQLVEQGIEYYGRGEYESAEAQFRHAIRLRDDNHVPYYYIGLILYNQGDFDRADEYFRVALERGAPEALVFFARGVNAFANDMFDDAVQFLERASDRDPAAFGDRAEQLITRIGN